MQWGYGEIRTPSPGGFQGGLAPYAFIGDPVESLRRVQQFFREVVAEFKKVTWPNRREVTGSTTVVIIVVFVIAIFLGVVDIGLSRIVSLILR